MARRTWPLLLLCLGGCPPADKGAVETGLSPDSHGDSPGDSTPDSEPAVDEDGDGFAPPEDCDDEDPGRFPGAEETCDWVDQDCDGQADDAPVDGAFWYRDGDGDGYGVETDGMQACERPEGYAAAAGDCDDADAGSSPGADEIPYDGIDQDCGYGPEDDDLDGDGYSAAEVGGDDCDDTDAAVYPGAPEVCLDGVVNDCLGEVASAREACGDFGAEAASTGGARLLGAEAGGNAGSALAGAGDLDGDGRGELLVGAFRASPRGEASGAVYLLYGGGALDGADDVVDAELTLEGEREYDFAGSALAGLGDVDGDGLGDVLVGAYGDFTGGTDAGAVYLLLGGTLGGEVGALGLGDGDLKLTGGAAADYAGRAVGAGGDLDGDGLADALVGAQGAGEAGEVYVLLGSGALSGAGSAALSAADGVFSGVKAGDAAGSAVAGAGDTDGDGLDDWLVGVASADGAGLGAGEVDLVLGGGVLGVGSLEDADRRFAGVEAGDASGSSVAGAGDLDGDGLGDVLVGAPGWDRVADQAGAALVLWGGGALIGASALDDADLTLLGAAEGDHAGEAVAGAGDTDGDGLADVLVGAPGVDAGAEDGGAALLLLGGRALLGAVGSLSLEEADRALWGEGAGDQAGGAVAGLGDTTGDGAGEWAFGACCEDSAGEDAGAAWWVRGAGY